MLPPGSKFFSAQSVVSLNTSRSASLSPGPPLVTSGLLVSPRRFSSRHVPHVAEELAQTPVLPPDIMARLTGLTRHLKANSDWEERQKEVLDANSERLIPEEYDETLRNEFERRCAYGERLNTEFMSSGKWVKLLREVGAIACSANDKAGSALSLADADIIFRKVLHHADYCGKRLTYEAFCKALYLAAMSARPELDGEAALVEMLARVAAASPEESRQLEEGIDYMLDPNVLLVLDNFKPALWDLFRTFCARNLGQAGGPCRGQGTVRLGERTFRRHTQTQDMLGTSIRGASGSRSPGRDVSAMSPSTLNKLAEQEHEDRQVSAPQMNSEADAGGGFTTPKRRGWHEESPGLLHSFSTPTSIMDQRIGVSSPKAMTAGAGLDRGFWNLSPRSTMQSMRGSLCSSSFPSQEPYAFASGAPVIKNRRHFMSSDQLLLLCKELDIMPELLTRLEVVRIFKRAQTAGTQTNHGSSIHGFINREAFVDAVGQLAIEAYSKEPFCDEFPEAHEKVHGFLLRVLPSNSHEVHERFLYGCSSRR